jgi:hypothetical protein
MGLLQMFCIVVLAILNPNFQKSVPHQKDTDYLVLDIRGKEDSSKFEFEGTQLSRSGKECVLQRLDGVAPFKLSLNGAVYLILRGKSGEGKVGMRYKLGKEEKRSFQYLNAGEAIVISFGDSAPGVRWHEGDSPFSRAEFSVWKKD